MKEKKGRCFTLTLFEYITRENKGEARGGRTIKNLPFSSLSSFWGWIKRGKWREIKAKYFSLFFLFFSPHLIFPNKENENWFIFIRHPSSPLNPNRLYQIPNSTFFYFALLFRPNNLALIQWVFIILNQRKHVKNWKTQMRGG